MSMDAKMATPETDSKTFMLGSPMATEHRTPEHCVVDADFARRLERERDSLRRALVVYQEIIPALRGVPHLVAARIAIAYGMAYDALAAFDQKGAE